MGHHLVTTRTYGVDDLGTFVSIGNFEFLLQENRSLLIRRLDYTRDELIVGGRRGWMQQRKKVDGLRMIIDEIKNGKCQRNVRIRTSCACAVGCTAGNSGTFRVLAPAMDWGSSGILSSPSQSIPPTMCGPFQEVVMERVGSTPRPRGWARCAEEVRFEKGSA